MIAAKLDMLTHLIAQHSKCAHYKIRDKQRLHHIFNECDAMSEAAYGTVLRSSVTTFIVAAQTLVEAAHQKNPEALADAQRKYDLAAADLRDMTEAET